MCDCWDCNSDIYKQDFISKLKIILGEEWIISDYFDFSSYTLKVSWCNVKRDMGGGINIDQFPGLCGAGILYNCDFKAIKREDIPNLLNLIIDVATKMKYTLLLMSHTEGSFNNYKLTNKMLEELGWQHIQATDFRNRRTYKDVRIFFKRLEKP